MLLDVQNMLASGSAKLVEVRAATVDEIRAGAAMLGGVVFQAGLGVSGGRLACGLDLAAVKGLGKIKGLGLGREKVVTIAGCSVSDYAPAAVAGGFDVDYHFVLFLGWVG